MMHKTTSDTPHELEISGRRSVTGIHRNRSCATAISSAYRAQRAVRRSIKSAPSSPTRSTSHECQVSAPYMGRSSSGTSSSFQYGQCSQAFSPPAVEMHRSALTISSFFFFVLRLVQI